jgi:hypothetical protein
VEGSLDNGGVGQLWIADGSAGRARKMTEMEEKEWVALVDIMECGGGSARSDGRGSKSGGEASPCKGGAPAWKQANSMQ